LFVGVDPQRIRRFFDEMSELGVEGMMVSPGYRYEKAPDQQHFLARNQTRRLFRELLRNPSPRWRFNHTPLFLEFLRGNWELECTPWGNPTYNIFGWQRPCYLLDEGYCQSFQELMETTAWNKYGHSSGNPKCRDCMVHCGYEPSAVAATFGSFRGLLKSAWISLRGFEPLDEPHPLDHPLDHRLDSTRSRRASVHAGDLPPAPPAPAGRNAQRRAVSELVTIETGLPADDRSIADHLK
jgi:hypothetical protein